MFELKPVFCKQKSFYGKAIVEESYTDNTVSLFSYCQKVCTISGTGSIRLYGKYNTQTTRKHIVEFVKQNQFRWEHRADKTDFANRLEEKETAKYKKLLNSLEYGKYNFKALMDFDISHYSDIDGNIVYVD